MSTKAPTGDFLGHPKGLFLLFGTEMWERFCFYGMRAILVLYLTSAAAVGAFGWTEMSQEELNQNALEYLAWYAFLIYLTPAIGGWIADNKWGQRKSIIFGGVLMMLGQFMLGTPHSLIPGMEKAFLWGGLILMIFGNGFFKPNISTMVGDLYSEGDRRKDAAFTIFYMGINIGSFFGQIIVGAIGEKVDYQYGFIAAGFAMLIGVILQLSLGNRYLGDIGKKPSALQDNENNSGAKKPLTAEDRDRIKVILVMSFFSVMFWAGFEQAAGSFNLFAKQNTDLNVFGWEMPASWLQSVNPMLIFILAPVMAVIWTSLGKKNKEPNSPTKFAFGMFFLALGFVMMVLAALQIGESGDVKASIWWLVLAYLFHTIGELCLSPIGLSMVSKLAPLRYLSLMMGLWFVFSGVGNFVAHKVGQVAVGDAGPFNTFLGVAIFAVICGIVLFLLRNKLVDWMHGAEDAIDPKGDTVEHETQKALGVEDER